MTTQAYGRRGGVAYHWRRLTPEQETAVRDAFNNGATAAALAARYGVHKRTIYRTLDRASHVYRTVNVSGWVATFEVTEDGPAQTGPWTPA